MLNLLKAFFCIGWLIALSLPVFAEQTQLSNAALPKRIQAVYTVTKNGQPFAKVHEQFVVNAKAYHIESITKGIGVYALFGERKLTSSGEVTALGLKPSRFELRQGDNPKKTLLAEFDWATQSLRMTVKGKQKEVALHESTQDLASYAYQFMYQPAMLKDLLTIVLTTGKKLNQYAYQVNAEPELIESGDVRYKTLHLIPPQTEGQETKELWLAVDYHYVPVRIQMVDENGQKLEQLLTELHME